MDVTRPPLRATTVSLVADAARLDLLFNTSPFAAVTEEPVEKQTVIGESIQPHGDDDPVKDRRLVPPLNDVLFHLATAGLVLSTQVTSNGVDAHGARARLAVTLAPNSKDEGSPLSILYGTLVRIVNELRTYAGIVLPTLPPYNDQVAEFMRLDRDDRLMYNDANDKVQADTLKALTEALNEALAR